MRIPKQLGLIGITEKVQRRFLLIFAQTNRFSGAVYELVETETHDELVMT